MRSCVYLLYAVVHGRCGFRNEDVSAGRVTENLVPDYRANFEARLDSLMVVEHGRKAKKNK